MVFLPSCFHPSNPFSCVQTDCRACVLWVCPVTDPWLNWLSQGLHGMPASSCGLGASVRPVALSQSVSLGVRDIIVSVLVVLKSPFVDVEDFDRVVGTGAGELDPGALLLDFTLSITLSILLAIPPTCSASLGPPAEPFYCQSVALSVRGCVMKGDNRILVWMTKQAFRQNLHNWHPIYFTLNHNFSVKHTTQKLCLVYFATPGFDHLFPSQLP